MLEDEKDEKPKRASASEMARKWGISVRRVRYLCAQHLVFGAKRDKKTGEWSICPTAERPIDRRAYRYRQVPVHFHDFIQHADVALKKSLANPKMTDEESWLFFCRGSAHHMHTVGRKSALRLRDVCDVIAGKAVEGRDVAFVEDVVRHVRALNLIRKAALEKRRLSMTLVREIMRVIVCGKRPVAQSARDVESLASLLKRISTSRNHPIIKAGDALEGIYEINPFIGYSERLGYLVANFILMRNGYPPAILYRAAFRSVVEYRRCYREHVSELRDPRHALPPPQSHRAFLCACLIKAVTRSCRLGIRPIKASEGY